MVETIPYTVSSAVVILGLEARRSDQRSHQLVVANHIERYRGPLEPECMRPIEVRYIVDGESSYVDVLGVDISKADFHACLLQGHKAAKKTFPNTPAGYRQLQRWLTNRKCSAVHACMEATGAYWMGLAVALYESKAKVSVVNPSRTAFFARSQLRRTKTDRVDAEMIAQFCRTQQPEAWVPPAPEVLELRGLLTYRDHLVQEQVRFKQLAREIRVGKKLKSLHAQQLERLQDAVAQVNAQIEALVQAHPALKAPVLALTAVRGIGLLTAASLVAKLPVERLRNEKAAAAYAGLTPREKQSGTSVHGKPRLCKTGNASLRRDLYMPAITAIKYNRHLQRFARRLKAKGKAPKVIIAAVMRKLVVLAYRIMKGAASTTLIAA